MTTELLYHGKAMNPVPSNGLISGFADSLHNKEAVVVKLEPGDATHYALLIVPCWTEQIRHDLGRYGIPAKQAEEYLFVSKLGDQESTGCFIHNHLPTLEFGVEPLSNNKWSQLVLAWWLTQLWEAIVEVRRRRTDEPANL